MDHSGKAQDDRAVQLGVSTERFEQLLTGANAAYGLIKERGPFYGQESVKDPTFRVTAEPVFLPHSLQAQLAQFGNDVYLLAKAIQNLPEESKNKLGSGLDYQIPFTWRVDAIFHDGKISINEIEAVDGANALMIAEQLAYNLQSITDSTVAHMVTTIRAMCGVTNPEKVCKVAFIKVNNQHASNSRRFVEAVIKLSKGTISMDLLFEEDLRAGKVQPQWKNYNGVLNESSLSPKDLQEMGVASEQIHFSGNYTALVNKGVFALFYDIGLKDFWMDNLGEDVYVRLKELLIPSQFIISAEQIDEARAAGRVVKASWAGSETSIINRGKGVGLPSGEVEQSSAERWEYLKELFARGVKMISQDFILPSKIHAYLRKKGTTLESVDWYNRIAIKYVCDGDPSSKITPFVSMTALEATLGPDVIPAGRKCAFTAATFEK